MAYSEYVYFGVQGHGTVFAVVAIAFATLVFDKKAGYGLVLASLGLIGIISTLRIDGILDNIGVTNLDNERWALWITTYVEVALFGIGLAIAEIA